MVDIEVSSREKGQVPRYFVRKTTRLSGGGQDGQGSINWNIIVDMYALPYENDLPLLSHVCIHVSSSA